MWSSTIVLFSVSICKRRLFEEFRAKLADIGVDTLPLTLRLYLLHTQINLVIFVSAYVLLLYILILYILLCTYYRSARGCSYHETKAASVTYWQARREFLDFFPTWYTTDGALYEQFGTDSLTTGMQ